VVNVDAQENIFRAEVVQLREDSITDSDIGSRQSTISRIGDKLENPNLNTSQYQNSSFEFWNVVLENGIQKQLLRQKDEEIKMLKEKLEAFNFQSSFLERNSFKVKKFQENQNFEDHNQVQNDEVTQSLKMQILLDDSELSLSTPIQSLNLKREIADNSQGQHMESIQETSPGEDEPKLNPIEIQKPNPELFEKYQEMDFPLDQNLLSQENPYEMIKSENELNKTLNSVEPLYENLRPLATNPIILQKEKVEDGMPEKVEKRSKSNSESDNEDYKKGNFPNQNLGVEAMKDKKKRDKKLKSSLSGNNLNQDKEDMLTEKPINFERMNNFRESPKQGRKKIFQGIFPFSMSRSSNKKKIIPLTREERNMMKYYHDPHSNPDRKFESKKKGKSSLESGTLAGSKRKMKRFQERNVFDDEDHRKYHSTPALEYDEGWESEKSDGFCYTPTSKSMECLNFPEEKSQKKITKPSPIYPVFPDEKFDDDSEEPWQSSLTMPKTERNSSKLKRKDEIKKTSKHYLKSHSSKKDSSDDSVLNKTSKPPKRTSKTKSSQSKAKVDSYSSTPILKRNEEAIKKGNEYEVSDKQKRDTSFTNFFSNAGIHPSLKSKSMGNLVNDDDLKENPGQKSFSNNRRSYMEPNLKRNDRKDATFTGFWGSFKVSPSKSVRDKKIRDSNFEENDSTFTRTKLEKEKSFKNKENKRVSRSNKDGQGKSTTTRKNHSASKSKKVQQKRNEGLDSDESFGRRSTLVSRSRLY